MAEVLSPLPQSSTVTMLQTHSRPSSSDAFQNSGNSQSYQQAQRMSNTPRSIHNSTSSYRPGPTAPVQPYSFQSAPQLRPETRTVSAPLNGTTQHQSTTLAPRSGHRHTSSSSTISSDMSSSPSVKAQRSPKKEDHFSSSARNSFINLSSVPDLSLTPFDNVSSNQPKSSPNRYRRTPSRMDSSNSVNRVSSGSAAVPSGSGMAAIEHLYTPPPVIAPMTRTASDDSTISKSTSAAEAAKRYRRRSLNSLESANFAPGTPGAQTTQGSRPTSHNGPPPSTIRPVSSHSRTTSSESINARRGHSTTPPVSRTHRV